MSEAVERVVDTLIDAALAGRLSWLEVDTAVEVLERAGWLSSEFEWNVYCSLRQLEDERIDAALQGSV